jgi:hypothetical protein
MCDGNGERGFRRNNYFMGKLLTERDFQDEQQYHISKRRFFNRCMYGSRIVCGLDVELIRHQVLIEKGLCLDCCGREIFFPVRDKISLPEMDGIYYLVLLYKEIGINPIPRPDSRGSDSDTVFQHIKETYELMWQADNPFTNHEFMGDAWKACGESHPVAIAKIVKRQHYVTLIEYARINEE